MTNSGVFKAHSVMFDDVRARLQGMEERYRTDPEYAERINNLPLPELHGDDIDELLAFKIQRGVPHGAAIIRHPEGADQREVAFALSTKLGLGEVELELATQLAYNGGLVMPERYVDDDGQTVPTADLEIS